MRTPRGRLWIALWLGFFLAMLGWVAARQTSAVVSATELRELRTARSVFEAQRADLLRRIRAGESRRVLVPRAESLGLRLPADSEILVLPIPGGRGGRAP